MIFKCHLCGSINKLEEDNFETYSSHAFIEHLLVHLEEYMDIYEDSNNEVKAKDKIIQELENEITKLKGKKMEEKLAAEKLAKIPSVEYLDKPVEVKKHEYVSPFAKPVIAEPKHRSRVPFTPKIKEILNQYYKVETAKQLRQRIIDETGIVVHISSIYNWTAKQSKKDNASQQHQS